MAGTVVNDYAIGDVNFNSMMETLDKQRRGYSALTLTNFDNTSAPAIAAGSLIEVDGSLVHFASEEAITGSPSDGTVYIKIIVSAGSATAAYTNTAPVWSDSKQGWYGEDASASHRYCGVLTLASGAYASKYFLPQKIFNLANQGHFNILLSNVESTSEAVIQAFSSIEVNGLLYLITADITPSGSPSDGTVYVKVVPGAGYTLTAEKTNTAPTWSESKKGWYGTGANATHRYVFACYLLSGAYYAKILIKNKNGEENRNLPAYVYETIATEKSTSSATFVAVSPSFTGSLNLTAGDLVVMKYAVEIKTNGTGTGYCYVTFGEDTTVNVSTDSSAYVPSTDVHFFIAPSTGTYTLVEYYRNDGGGTTYIRNRFVWFYRYSSTLFHSMI